MAKASVLNDIANTPALLGMQMRVKVTELEPTKGNYDFSSIISQAAELAALPGKVGRLSVLIETKTWNPPNSPVKHVLPAWMRTAEYAGGEYTYTSGNTPGVTGFGIKLYNAKVQERLALLAGALGQALNGIANIELIGVTETSQGGAVSDADYTDAGHGQGIIALDQALTAAFPNKFVRQLVNFPGSQLDDIVDAIVANGGAAGWPNTMEDEKTLELHQNRWPGVYPHARATAGQIVWAVEVQKPDYFYSNMTWDDAVQSGGHYPLPQQILDFAKTFGVNYMIWTRVMDILPQTGTPAWTEVLELLNQPSQLVPAGGLNNQLPTAYF